MIYQPLAFCSNVMVGFCARGSEGGGGGAGGAASPLRPGAPGAAGAEREPASRDSQGGGAWNKGGNPIRERYYYSPFDLASRGQHSQYLFVLNNK